MDEKTSQELWATYAGIIDRDTVQAVFSLFSQAYARGINRVHLLLHTPGGSPSDGTCIYNYLKSHPVDVVAYNMGSVASAGISWWLGARTRVVSPVANFMIHRSESPVGNGGTAEALMALSHSVALGSAAIEAIYREHLTLSEADWSTAKTTNLYLGADQSVACGLSTQIGHFIPHGTIVTYRPGQGFQP